MMNFKAGLYGASALLATGILGASLWQTSALAEDDAATAPEQTTTSVTAKSTAPPIPAPKRATNQRRVREASERGLAYLAMQQDSNDGAWRQDVGFKFNYSYERSAENKPHVGVTALALMSFLAGGHLPGRGHYGHVVEKGLDFVLSCVDENTGFISAYETRMYSHAFASLFLAEIYGMTHRSDVHAKLQQAIDLTVKTQNRQGSWRYRPYAPDSDMSIAVCQLMALRAARNIGIQVPRATIRRAYGYIQDSAIRSGRNTGNFRYQIDNSDSRNSFALTAAGLASLLHAGYYNDELIAPGIKALKNKIRRLSRNERYGTYFYWYGHYYAAQVMFIVGDRDRSIWDDFYWPKVSESLLKEQKSDGSWTNTVGPGDAFSTAVACIILQLPNQFLPIFQR